METVMKTLNDYSAECFHANRLWWVDINQTCNRCGGHGFIFDCRSNPNCEDCLGTGHPRLEYRNIGELLMLCVSELAEAMEGHRKDLMDDKIPTRKMFEVELADTLIRIFDLAGGLGFSLSIHWATEFTDLNFLSKKAMELYGAHISLSSNVGESLLYCVRHLVLAAQACKAWSINKSLVTKNEAQDELRFAIVSIVRLAAAHDLDMEGAYREKMAYNAKRRDHTVEGRKQAGGKKY